MSPSNIDYMPAPDALCRRTPAPYRSSHNVIGVRLMLETNAPEILERAAGVLGPPLIDSRDMSLDGPVRLRLLVHEAHGADVAPPKPIVRSQDEYLLSAAGGSLGFADGAHGFGAAFVTPEAVRSGRLLESGFIELLGVFLASRQGRSTLHAAAVVLNGRCVLLTGAGGAGKSTLAHACVRAGFGLLAEDVVFVRKQGDAVKGWGVPWSLSLLPDARRLFPELDGMSAAATIAVCSEAKLRIDVAALRPDAPVTDGLPLSDVLLVERVRSAGSCVAPVEPRAVRRALCEFQGDPILNVEQIEDAASVLAQGRIGRLCVGSDLDAAVEVVRRWMGG